MPILIEVSYLSVFHEIVPSEMAELLIPLALEMCYLQKQWAHRSSSEEVEVKHLVDDFCSE